MQVTWETKEESQSDGLDMVWVSGQNTVNAVLYDTGEWVIRYNDTGGDVFELYARGVYSRSDAITEAQACMDELTATAVQSEEMTNSEEN